MRERIYYFSPGPAVLPFSVLPQAGRGIVNFNNKGIGLIELSHRSKEFTAVTEETEALIRENMGIPANYKVLFLQGGASSPFFMVPMQPAGAGQESHLPEQRGLVQERDQGSAAVRSDRCRLFQRGGQVQPRAPGQ